LGKEILKGGRKGGNRLKEERQRENRKLWGKKNAN
jgi:hypothetical protein